jgi:hypothetical protein
MRERNNRSAATGALRNTTALAPRQFFIPSIRSAPMKTRLAIAIGLIAITSGCSSMGAIQGDGGGDAGERSYMGGSAPTEVDAAGSATHGTGSISTTNADPRMNTASGIGTDD